jgi:hypothetical protein
MLYIFARVPLDAVEDPLQSGDTLANSFGNFIIRVPQLHLLEDRKRYGVNEDDASINTRCIDYKYLLITLLK